MSSAPLRGAAKYMEKGGGGGAPLSSAALHAAACTYGQGDREEVLVLRSQLCSGVGKRTRDGERQQKAE